MAVNYNAFKAFNRFDKEIEISLARPNKQIIGRINEAYNIKQVLKLGQINEITFNIPYQIEKNSIIKQNKHVDMIKQRYLLKVNYLNKEEWYVIAAESDSLNDTNVKQVTAYSLGYQLADKMLKAWPGVEIDGEYRKESLNAVQLLENLLSESSWNLDALRMDLSFSSMYRTFDFASTTVLDAVFTVAEKFNAIISWDTHNKLLYLIDAEKYGTFRGLQLSDNRYLRSYEKVTKSDEMATRLKVYGQDGISINEVNPTGTDFIEDYSFFMRGFKIENNVVVSSSPYMSDGLCKAILAYQTFTTSLSGLFTSYLEEKETYEQQKIDKERELATLKAELFAIETSIDFKESLLEDAGAEKTAEANKKIEIASKEQEILNIKLLIQDVIVLIDGLTNQLSYGENFTVAQREELDNFIIVRTWENENISDPTELLELAEKELVKLNRPNITYNISLVYLLKLAEMETIGTKLRLGDKIRVIKKELDEIVESQIIEISIDYQSEDINLVIADSTNLTDEEALVKLLYKSISSSSTLELNKNKWNDISRVDSLVSYVLDNKWDSAKREILAGANESVTINNRGITASDSTDPNRFIRITHGVLGMTDDGGNTFKLAIDSTGVYAERLVGRIIVGENLYLENTGGTFRFNQDGVTIQGNALRIIAADDTNLIDKWNAAEANAKAYADSMKLQIQDEIDDIQLTLDNFDSEVLDAFADGIISEAESISIGNYTNTLNTEKADIDLRFQSIYNNVQLTGTPKTELNTKKLTYNTAHTNLLSSIDIAIDDKKTTLAEKADVDAKFALYRTALSQLSVAFEDAINTIAQAKATLAKENALEASVKLGQTINGVKIDTQEGLVVTRGDDKVKAVFNATEGIIISTKSTNDQWKDTFKYDTEKALLVVEGEINAQDLKIKGEPVLTNNGKIAVGAIENLEVGTNVTMGPNATISWSQLDTSAKENIEASQMTWLGSFDSYPPSPSKNDGFYHTIDKKSYIYTGTVWNVLAQDGAIGPRGVGAVTAVLSNDSHVLPANSDGIVTDFTGCETTFYIYEGAQNLTAEWQASVVATNLTYQVSNDRRYFITGISADVGYLDFTFTRIGYDTVTKRFTVSKVKQGSEGGSTTMYWLDSSSPVIAKNVNGQYTPSTIQFNGYSKLGSFVRFFYSGRFIVATSTDGTNYTNQYISPVNEWYVSYPIVLPNIKTIRVQMYMAGGTTELLDEQIIPIVSDGLTGASGITSLLSNDSHVLAADFEGNILSYAGCSTTVAVYEGATETTSAWTATVAATNLTYTTSGKTYSIIGMSANADTGYLDITLTRSGYDTITKRFTVTKAKHGEDGLTGADSRSYWLVVSAPAIAKSILGAYTPSSITVTSKFQNGAETPTNYAGRFVIATSTDGSTYTNKYISSANESSTLFNPEANLKTIRVQMYLAGGTTVLVDEQIIPIISDGATGESGTSAITAVLSNDSHVLNSDSNGVVSSFAGCNTTAYVYQGATDVSSSWTATVTATNITYTTSGKTFTITGLSADTGYLDIVLTRSGFSSITKRFTVTKAKQGAQGAQGSTATSYWLVNSTPAIGKNVSGVYNPSSITVTGKSQTSTNAPVDYPCRFIIATSTDGTTYTTQYTSTSNEASKTYSVTLPNIKTIKVQMYLAGGTSTLLDEQIIPIVSDGATGADGASGVNAITAVLSNDSHVLNADNNGNVASFVGCNTTVYIYEGATDVSSSWTATPTASNLTYTTSGKTYTITGLSADVGYLDIVLARTGYASITKRFTVTKAKGGADGSDGSDGSDGLNATSYWLVNSVPAIGKNILGVYTPSSITVTGKTQTGTSSPTNYSGRFVIATSTNGSTYTTRYTSSSNESSTTYSVSLANLKTIRVQMFLAGGTSTLLDEQIIPIVSDGATGADGADGTSAITSVLSNDSHVLNADNSGTVSSFAGCNTTVFVYQGATDVSSVWAATVVASNLTYTTSEKTFSITGISADIGYLDITLTRTGYANIVKRFTVTKAKGGINGSNGSNGLNATSYWLVNSVPAIGKSIAGAYTPSTITATGKSQTGTSTPVNYSGRFVISTSTNGTTYTTKYTSSANEISTSYNPEANIKTIKVQMYLAGGTTTLVDEQIIPIVSDGATGEPGVSAITAVLSNDSHVLNTDSNGVVASFAGCNTTAYVYQGSTDVSSSWTATVTATNLTYTTSGKTFTITGASADIGYLDITLTRSGYSSIIKRFTVTKAKQGSDGSNGTNGLNATSYWLVNSVPAIGKNVSGVYNPSSITVTGKSQTGTNAPVNYSGRFIISTSLDGTTYTNRYTSTTNESSTNYSVNLANIKTIKVQMYLAGGTTTLLDEQIIPIVSDGVDGINGESGVSAITAVLSNDSHVLNADVNGVVASFAGCNTTAYVYQGSTDVSSSWNATVTASNLTFTTSGKTFTITGISADIGYLDITLTRTGFANIVKRFTVTKAKQGAQGAQGTTATSYWLVNSVPAIGKSVSGIYNPSSITVTGKSQTGTNAPTDYACRFIISTSLDGTAYTTQYTSTSNESSKTYSVNLANIKTIKVQMYLAGGITTLLDEQIIPIVSDGADGVSGTNAITAVLSNDSHVLNADNNGNVASFAGCNTTIYIYEGATDVSDLWTATPTASNLTYTTSGKTYTITGLSADTGYLDITLTRTGYASITKRFTVTKAKQGSNGSDGLNGVNGTNATSYWLVNSVPAIGKNITGAYTPSSITVTGKSQTGTNSPVNYSGRFIISTSTDGTAYTTQYTSAANETTKAYPVNIANLKTIKVQMYLAGGTTTLLDEQIIPIVSDGATGSTGATGATGANAITAVLSNDSHVLNADSSGNVSSFVGCVTTAYIYEGATDVSSSWTATVTTSNLTSTTSGKTFTVTAMSADTGYLDITLTRTGYANIVKRFTVTKAKGGTNGSNGSNGLNATSYWLVNSVPAIGKNISGVYNPSSIIVTGRTQTGTSSPADYSGRFIIATSTDGLTYTTQYTSTSNESSKTYSVNIANIKTIKVQMYLAGGTSTLLDEQIIPIVSDGATGQSGTSAITSVLSNDSHVLYADSSGFVTSFAGCNTTVYVYEGIADVSSSWTATVTATNLTYTTSGKTYSVTGLSADTGYLDIVLARTGYASITKRFTVTKAKQGSQGVTATSYWLVNSVPAISKNSWGVYTPSTITITGKSQTGTNSPTNYSGRFIISTSTNGTDYTTQYTSTSNEASTTYSVNITGLKTIKVQMYLAGGTSTLLDEQIITIVSDGSLGPQGPQGPQGIPGSNANVPSYIQGTYISATEIRSPVLTGNTFIGANGLVGMTSDGDNSASVRLWAGEGYWRRNYAPFHVTQEGVVTMGRANLTTSYSATNEIIQINGSVISAYKNGVGTLYSLSPRLAIFSGSAYGGELLIKTYLNATSETRVKTLSFFENIIGYLYKTNTSGNIGSNLLIGGFADGTIGSGHVSAVIISKYASVLALDNITTTSSLYVDGRATITGGTVSTAGSETLGYGALQTFALTTKPTSFEEGMHNIFAEEGTIMYDNDTKNLKFYNGTEWKTILAN